MRRFLVLAVMLASIFTSTSGPMVPSALAQAAPFDCSTVVTNGGFENPQLAPLSSSINGATGWGGSYYLFNDSDDAHSGNQLASPTVGVGLTQQLNTSGLLAGDTLTIGFWNDNAATATLGTSSTTTPFTANFVYQFASVSYTLVTDAEELTLSITKVEGAPIIDDMSASCTRLAPVDANDQPISVAYEGSANGTLTASGGSGAYTFAEAGGPTKGSVSIDPDGSFTYTADDDQSGTDSFTFTVTDSANSAMTDTGTVTITIAAPEALETQPLTLTIDAGQVSTGTLSGQVSGGDAPYTFSLLTNGTQGSATVETDGSFTYTADLDASGSDTFTYTVSDDQVPPATTTGTVTFTITAAPEPIPDTTLSVTADPRFAIAGSATIDGFDDLTYALDTAPSNGTVTVDPDGSYSYLANNIYLAGDTFTVLATAPGGETALVTVHITYAIDPTVPTSGTVSPGSTGNGGDEEDARSGSSSPSEPAPTSTPADGRVQR